MTTIFPEVPSKPLPTIEQMLTELVAVNSISSTESSLDRSNAGVIDLLAGWLRAAGAEVTVHEVISTPRKLNLIARIGQGDGGLVFSGHTDTVPYDGQRWATDPFVLTEQSGRLHGLGATDMKGFIAVAVTVLARHRHHPLKKPLWLVATCDEESTMSGARWLQETGLLKADYVVIGEPTDLVPVRAHKGHLAHRLCAHGHSGHSSDPAAGRNAIDGVHAAMSELMAWRKQLQQDHRDDSFAVPYPTLNFGRIAGGDAVNRICPDAELDFDLRPLPDMALPALYTALHQQIRSAQEHSAATLELQELWPGTPAFSTPASATLVSTAQELTGSAAVCVNYGTEAPYFRALGAEVIVLGPGRIDRAHQPNEYVTRDELARCEVLLNEMVQRLCL
ncbi:acetylornithine deacetylase [Permianibacter sp. IMCC34836]|uniref:acetylornithine deacetylase n=1 Tax=Permianibacter fluminis TaxID=2738515 RepID=UPI001553B0B6|nr:acetylornithine deacetylase [Permianibacter fluminis]NQD37428.1 acetylornithine deacetylase [Permianibacter fluminis]